MLTNNCKLCGAETDKEYCTPDHRRISDNMYTSESYIEYCERRAKMLIKRREKRLTKKI